MRILGCSVNGVLDTVGHATAFGKPVVDHWSGSRLIQITLSLYYLHQPWYKAHFHYTTYTSRGTNHTFVILLTPAVVQITLSVYYLHQPWYKSHFRYTTYTSRGTNHTFVILLTPAVVQITLSLYYLHQPWYKAHFHYTTYTSH